MGLSREDRKLFEEFQRVRSRNVLRATVMNLLWGAAWAAMSFWILWGAFGLDPVTAVRAGGGGAMCVLLPILIIGVVVATMQDAAVKRACEALEADRVARGEGRE